jgi:hypothetical protein
MPAETAASVILVRQNKESLALTVITTAVGPFSGRCQDTHFLAVVDALETRGGDPVECAPGARPPCFVR